MRGLGAHSPHQTGLFHPLILARSRFLTRKRAIGTVVSKRTNTIGHALIVTPDFSSHRHVEWLSALIRIGQELGIQCHLLQLSQNQKTAFLLKKMHFTPAEGAVLLLAHPEKLAINLINHFLKLGYYTVNIETHLEKDLCSYVGMSDESAIELGVERLAEAGHRRIVFLVTEPEEYESVRLRVLHFEEITKRKGLSSAHVHHAGVHSGENSSEASSTAMAALWKEKVRPTAIFAVSDSCAVGALSWLHMNGIRVPEDVSLLSFDGTTMTRCTHPQITSIRQPYQKIAQAAFQLVLERPTIQKNILLAPLFLDGGSLQRIPAN